MHASDIERQLRKAADAVGYFGTLFIKRYVRVRYDDELGEENLKYFLANDNGGYEVDAKEGEKAFSYFKDGPVPFNLVEFDNLTGGALVAKTLETIEHPNK